MENRYEKAKEILKNNHQEHIISIMDKLNENKKEILADQILSLDFKEIDDLYKMTENNKEKCLSNLEKVDVINPEDLTESEIHEYIKVGKKAIQEKKLAVAIMAGGQGSRLGHNGPKGTFKINLNNESKYLFELLIDKLKKAKRKYGVYIKCYIMTSEENNDETVRFFEKMKYFGYPKKYITFFKQNSTLIVNEQGKVVIGEDYLIKTSSNGNGEIFSSMKQQGIIKELKDNNVEWLFIGPVDNVLLHLVDTMLLGVAIKNNEEIATRTVLKRNAMENVGVFCKQNDRIRVIEYTEMPKEVAELVDDKGNLIFGESHIMCNLFSVKALEKACDKKLDYHLAHKKITYLDEDGILVRPEKPNCYKFERFIFDAFSLFKNIAILRGKREFDFAPIKNAEGVDSPETAKQMYENYIKSIRNKNTRK